MDSRNVAPTAGVSQQFQPNPSSSLDSLIADLRGLRNGMISKDRRRRSAILIGQMLLLAREYQLGRPPNRKTLRRFFYFVTREQAV